MNPEIKTQWVTALRSGDYVQGKNVLQNERQEFCCLGVLCDLAVKAGVIAKYKSSGGITLYAGSASFLPLKVQEWAEMEHPSDLPRTVPGTGGVSNLMHLNDETGFTFEEIADVIEGQL